MKKPVAIKKPVPRKLMPYAERHTQMLNAGAKLVKGDDYSNVSGAAIAKACKCSGPLVFSHFKDRDVLRAAVRKHVLATGPKVAKKSPKKFAVPAAPAGAQ